MGQISFLYFTLRLFRKWLSTARYLVNQNTIQRFSESILSTIVIPVYGAQHLHTYLMLYYQILKHANLSQKIHAV